MSHESWMNGRMFNRRMIMWFFQNLIHTMIIKNWRLNIEDWSVDRLEIVRLVCWSILTQNFICLRRKTIHEPARQPLTPHCVHKWPCHSDQSPDSLSRTDRSGCFSVGTARRNLLYIGTILEMPLHRKFQYRRDPSMRSPPAGGSLSRDDRRLG